MTTNTIKANADIRKAARIADIPLWRIGEKLGISEPTMIRWLRSELPEDKRQRILNAINEISKEQENEFDE